MLSVSPPQFLPATCPVDVLDRLAGVLLGTAMGDALGLPTEGMSAAAVARDYPALERYRWLGRTGFVSDDTEQTALVAQSLVRSPRDLEAFVRVFRRSLLGWFLRLPWGIGLATLRACLRIAVGLRRSGVPSAGNGAAMRASIVGAYFFDAPDRRRAWSDALARVTHTDPRAVEGARYVAEMTALCVARGPSAVAADLVNEARNVVQEPALRDAIDRATDLAVRGASAPQAAKVLGNTGFVVHTVGILTYCFVRLGLGDRSGAAIALAVQAGGDTDSHAAIVGAWTGAAHGVAGLPAALMRLQAGPFGAAHLRALASDLERARRGQPPEGSGFPWPLALGRNLVMYPVAVLHAFRVFSRRAG